MKKHFFIYFLVLMLFFSIPGIQVYATATATDALTDDTAPHPSDAPEIACPQAIVMDIDTGTILYQKDAYSANYPASITKVLTALVALENADLSETVTFSENAIYGIDRDSSHIGLNVGEKISFEDAMYGMMLESANEAAIGIAEHIAGSVEAFSDMMNETASALGCVNSHFVNPNGLHDDNHYTCAYDMALIGCAAYKNATYRQIIGSLSYTIPATNLSDAREIWQNNGMIFTTSKYYYEYCTGGKTGYTTVANGTLVAYAEKDGMRLVCVTMNAIPSANTFYDSKALFDFCFENYARIKPLSEFSFERPDINAELDASSVLGNYYDTVDANIFNLSVNTDAEFIIRSNIPIEDITWRVEYYSEPQGNTLGRMILLYNNEEIGSTPVYYDGQTSGRFMNQAETDGEEGFSINPLIIIPAVLIIGAVALSLRIRYVRIKRRKYRENRRFHYYR